MSKVRYYVVWKGRRRGIFSTWPDCEAQVKGFVGAQFKAFASRTEAERAFAAVYTDFEGQPSSSQKWLFAPVKPVLLSIVVDAACSGSPGPLEYRGVDLETQKQIFKEGPFAEGTNNVGEFLAIVEAMIWLEEHERSRPIYSDSENAIAWVKAGECNTKLRRTPANAKLFDLIAKAERRLNSSKDDTGRPKILKWDTAAWGENPADFGRK